MKTAGLKLLWCLQSVYAMAEVYFIWAAMLSFAFGVYLAEIMRWGLHREWLLPLAGLGGLILLLALLRNRPILLLPLFLLLGLVWSDLAQERLNSFAVPPGEALFFEGRVVEVLSNKQNAFGQLAETPGSGCSFIMQGVEQNGWRGRLLIVSSPMTPRVGDRLRVCGLVNRLNEMHNFALDGSRYFYSRSIAAAVRPTPQGVSLLRLAAPYAPQNLANNMRERLWQYMTVLPQEQNALLRGIGFGDTSLLTNGQSGVLAQTGIMHVFAVSGLHIGYVVLLGGWFLAALRAPRWLHFLGTALLVIFFALVVGPTASVLRAAVMTLIGGLGVVLADGRAEGRHSVCSLVLAVFLLLLWQPNWALQPGFLLSFAATAGIVCTAEYWRLLAPSKILSIGLAAQFMIMPILAYFFNTISLVGLLISPFLACAAGLVVILLLLAMPLTFCGLAYVPLAGAGWLAEMMYKLAELLAGLPGAFVYTLRPGWLAIIIYYTLLLAAFYCLAKVRNALKKPYIKRRG